MKQIRILEILSRVLQAITGSLSLTFALWLACGAQAEAKPLQEFYRGTRAMAMGNAFTAVSDDADAVFYNPAGLALNPNYELRLVNPKIDLSTDDLTAVGSLRSAASKFDANSMSALFGKHVYGNVSAYPSLYFPGFIVGYYGSVGAQVIARNTAMPQIESRYIRDQGVVAGAGYEVGGLGKRDSFRMGFAVKWLTRQGFDTTIPLTSLVLADQSTFSRLMGGPSIGWGASAGLQYEVGITRTNDLVLGAAWQDIGDTSFGGSTAASPPPPIRNNLAGGAALIHRFNSNIHSKNNFKLSAEMRHLLERGKDPRLKMHFGGELALGGLSVQGGYSQDGLTAGATVNIWFLRVGAVTYGVENQSLAFLDRERRYMLEVTIHLDLMGKKSLSHRDSEIKKHPRQY